jgi:NAD(P)-dependent dehydrogenase (short-subunit alcohol dehydrogenase family)
VPAGRISVVPADLSDEEDRGRAAVAVLEAGRVDILVNNAATVEPLGPTIAIPAGELRLAFEVNVAPRRARRRCAGRHARRPLGARGQRLQRDRRANPAGMVRGNAYATTKARPATASGRGIRVYLTAMTSTGLMEGSLASSSSAVLPSASASGPAMCAWRPFSLAKVSKIP